MADKGERVSGRGGTSGAGAERRGGPRPEEPTREVQREVAERIGREYEECEEYEV